jgi:hypothetical protein
MGGREAGPVINELNFWSCNIRVKENGKKRMVSSI